MTNFIFRNHIPLVIVLFLISSCHFSSSIEVNITIFRNSTLPKTNSRDRFNISSRGCDNNTDLCTTFGGTKLQDNCQCTCGEDKSTFGFYDGKWKYTKNSVVRQHSGCSYYLHSFYSGHLQDAPLYTLPVLGPARDINFVRGIPRGKSCNFVKNNATFLKCDGTWGQLNEQNFKDVLVLALSGQFLYVGPFIDPPQRKNVLTGKLIRIPIECSGIIWSPSQCVALKLKGKINCLLVNITTNYDKTPQSTLTPPETTVDSKTTTISNNSKPKKGSSSDKHTGIIVGSVIAVIAVILIVVVVLLYRKRQQKSRQRSNTNQNSSDSTHEYDYADMDGDLARSTNNASNEMQQHSIPDTFEYDYPSVVPISSQNRVQGIRQRAIPDSVNTSQPNKDNITSSDYKPNECSKNEELVHGPSSEPAYQPLQIKSLQDSMYQPLDRSSGIAADDQYENWLVEHNS